ncbi:hypothetical protein RQN30_04860 [Arcanobacterium hippocoleae]
MKVRKSALELTQMRRHIAFRKCIDGVSYFCVAAMKLVFVWVESGVFA